MRQWTFVLIVALLTSLIAACQPTAESGSVLFSDDFSNPDSGWLRQSDAEASTDYFDDEFQIFIYSPRLAVFSYTETQYSDVSITVETRTPPDAPIDNLLGVICRRRDDSNYYYLGISADGYFGIGLVQNGADSLIHRVDANWDASPNILQGAATNTLTATCIGNQLTLSVNGVVIAEATDSTLQRGTIGLYGRSFREGFVDVRFDNLVVRQP